MFPFTSLATEYRELGYVVAVLVGFGFGFVLERAGFGRAPKLAAQFYLHDMTVLKVMFSAIVTAMLGTVVAAGFGLVDLRALAEQAASATNLWPMIAGGAALGAGFIIAGYCPGTSIVAAASGNIDGMVTVVGVVLGSLAYTELQPAIQGFHDSGALGAFFLYDWLHVPPAVIAIAVALMAIGAFFGAEKLEAIFRARRGEAPAAAAPSPGRFAFAGFVAAAALGLLTLAVPKPSPASLQRPLEETSAATLASLVLETPWAVRVLDLRAAAACAKERVPGSECAPLATLESLGLAYDTTGRQLVLVGDGAMAELPAPARAYPGRVLVLGGGYAAWRAYALTPPAVPGPDATTAERDAYRLRAGLHAALTGVEQAPPPPPPTKAVLAPKKKAGGGCGG